MLNTHEIGSIVTVEAKFSEAIAACKLFWRRPDSDVVQEYDLSGAELGSDGTVTHDLSVDSAGEWYYRFEAQAPQVGVAEGAFLVDGDQVRDAVTDLRDVRTLIPRVRRALLGPVSTTDVTLTDEDAVGLLADAIADVILYTYSSELFGYKLEVVARDGKYNAPVSWRTDLELSIEAQSIVVAQAALNYFMHELSASLKMSETIRDEGREWTYSLSANLLRDRLNALMKLRDLAFESLSKSAVLDSYVNLLHERDAWVTAHIEPFAGGNSIGGMEFSSGYVVP